MRALLAVICLVPALAWAQQQEDRKTAIRNLAWQQGPVEAKIGAKATILVPQGYVFLDESNTSRFLQLVGNPPRNGHYLLAPRNLGWFAVFAFDSTGYVKDDEKIDPDALLKSLKESDEAENEERKKLGMEAIYTAGWAVPPHYDERTKRLEWGTRLRSASGRENVNYTSRLLGRTGVMRAILVADVATLAQDTADFQTALNDFSYVSGEKYAEFKQGDRVAQFGLAALVLGGAAAVATKKGFWTALVAFFGAFWKLIAGAAVAGWAGFKALFKKKE